MKIYAASRAAAYIAGFMLSVSTVSATGVASLLPVPSKEPVVRTWESFKVELKPVNNSTTLQLVIRKPLGKKVWIMFKSPDGTVIESFSTEKNTTGISRNYNFNDAEEGTYSFEITDRNFTETKLVKLESVTTKTTQNLVIK